MDIGCGPNGTALQGLKSMYGDAVEAFGIDLNIQNKGDNVRLVEGDVLALPFADEFFDFVYELGLTVYLNAEEFNGLLQEMLRVLRPGGRCILNFLPVTEEDKYLVQKALAGQNCAIEAKESIIVIRKNEEHGRQIKSGEEKISLFALLEQAI